MDQRDIEFQKRIKETFRIEAEEHLTAFSAGLLELEKPQTEKRLTEIIETMFREIHSLKGAARSVDQKEIESLCQPLEGAFSALKCGQMKLSQSSLDLFFKTADLLTKIIIGSVSDKTQGDSQLRMELTRNLKTITEKAVTDTVIQEPVFLKGFDPFADKTTCETEAKTETTADFSKNEVPKSFETVRIRTSKLEPLLLQAEELIRIKMAISQYLNDLEEINIWVAGKKAGSVKWNVNQSVDTAALLKERNDDYESCLNKMEGHLSGLTRSIERDQYSLDSLIDNHLEAMRQILMLPVSSLVEIFPGMVREISHEQNKEIDFVIRGSELEIDKRILDELKDPLIHLIRNSIDHGIGIPQERILQNKPKYGTIILNFTAMESGMIEITLSDDGRGIDTELVMNAAIKSGSLTRKAAEKLDAREKMSLIYQSGVSTSKIITDISGRGLGLSIVREKVEKLNGTLAVETEDSKGTTFHILLPMTIATFRGILVTVDEFMFILPTMNVERVMRVEPEKVLKVKNFETIIVEERILSVADLGEVLGFPHHKHAGTPKMKPGRENQDQIIIVVLVSGEQRIAFRVDEVVDEQQVLVKGLGKLLNRVRNISGATILGTGKVVPVLNVTDLMKSAVKISGEKGKKHTGRTFVPKTGKILVAEDSITSRTLIKNILETAGYMVTVSVDGADAFVKASSEDFDVIVSDVDMPRMNGFELTAKIRQDKKLKEIPVVLITALGSREDRERGIEVGADAYIVKSNFDQTNLIEIIKKLM
jgi:two-component system chemotaxis sensor kinase CheA